MSYKLILPFLRPIEPLLLDDGISEIMGNPDSTWWYERDGILERDQSICFETDKLRTGLEVIANKFGKKLDEDTPFLNVQLPDGSRLAAVIPLRLYGLLRQWLSASFLVANTPSMT
ncbi:MAG: hypothetical protein ACYDC6_07600 [Acidobacteriaceae bacterium]